MVAIYQMFFGWMPAIFQAVVLGMLALLVIIIVVRIVKIILDAIPFL